MTGSSGGRVTVLRPLQSQITFWAVCGLAALFVADAAVRGRVWLTVRSGLFLLFICWCAWAFLWRMSVRLDDDGLTAQNLLRWVRVPWERVSDVHRRAQLRLELDDGSHVDCWGSPFPPRTGVRAMTNTVRMDDAAHRAGSREHVRMPKPDDRALELVRGAWLDAAARRDAGQAVRRGWDGPAVVAGAVLAVCAVLAVLL